MVPYDARDLVSVPGLLSLSRLPLAASFPWLVHRPTAALGVLIAAGATDVLDGWCARRFGKVSATGALLDGATDKVFGLVVVGTLAATRVLPPGVVPLLAARELAELPLAAWYVANHEARLGRDSYPAANLTGKVATLLQFCAVGAALLDAPVTRPLIVATAIAGVVAAFGYWRRALAPKAGPLRRDPAIVLSPRRQRSQS